MTSNQLLNFGVFTLLYFIRIFLFFQAAVVNLLIHSDLCSSGVLRTSVLLESSGHLLPLWLHLHRGSSIFVKMQLSVINPESWSLCHYIMSYCHFKVIYATINSTHCNGWNPQSLAHSHMYHELWLFVWEKPHSLVLYLWVRSIYIVCKSLVESHLWNIIAAVGFPELVRDLSSFNSFWFYYLCTASRWIESFADFQTLLCTVTYINNFWCVAGAHSACPSHSNNHVLFVELSSMKMHVPYVPHMSPFE